MPAVTLTPSCLRYAHGRPSTGEDKKADRNSCDGTTDETSGSCCDRVCWSRPARWRRPRSLTPACKPRSRRCPGSRCRSAAAQCRLCAGSGMNGYPGPIHVRNSAINLLSAVRASSKNCSPREAGSRAARRAADRPGRTARPAVRGPDSDTAVIWRRRRGPWRNPGNAAPASEVSSRAGASERRAGEICRVARL